MPRRVEYKTGHIQVEHGDTDALTDELERELGNIAREFDTLGSLKILNGRLVEAVELGAGATTQVEHGLGRPYVGWFVVGGSVNGDYPGEGASDDVSKWVALTVTGAQTVDLWVF